MILDNKFRNLYELDKFITKHFANYILSEIHEHKNEKFNESVLILNNIHKKYGTVETKKLANLIKWNK